MTLSAKAEMKKGKAEIIFAKAETKKGKAITSSAIAKMVLLTTKMQKR